jgi:mannose-1-phosphate guanylyltransferase
MVVTGRAHAEAVRHEVGASADVVVEPTPRNSMPAIALAAALVEREDPDSVIGSFAADHVIADVEAFHAAVTTARRAAESGYLVTIGITPTHAATGFGYIEIDEAEEGDETDGGEAEGTLPAARSRGDLPDGALPVHRFVEKPDAGTAQRFLDSGSFLWNAGMFVMRARDLLGPPPGPPIPRRSRPVCGRSPRVPTPRAPGPRSTRPCSSASGPP